MQFSEVVKEIADILKDFDSEQPIHGKYQPGIGPFGEPQLVREIAHRLSLREIPARTHRQPDMSVRDTWAIEE